ncbi:hypothetical protein ASE17_16635 [Phenylobacterium sp. Root77]|jgi:hypothetical protein|uniref:hypothetical protein n=1 Tax=unclassified Phenylobacterium TaxID=2640670 RepID=UPI0006F9E256|nr:MULTISPECIES: hypothetical protein [unclassified Phenylobacterium]KQW70511.1 hypothetical protein ASC73_10505 [Phenylobacterium sp. Root1277]KQW91068.1 hypothetical protein ASC79_17085 [Phenylobacterium sp. Root1290]KRC39299.1 hypothetical protein ASE17_16635 [Phenylobacterium sp. Root77]
MRTLVIAALGVTLAAGAVQAQVPTIPVEALKAAGLDPHTKVDGGAVQVLTGQRAVIDIDDSGKLKLEDVETGRIGMAASDGKETYKGAGAGKLAFALDASVEKRQSILKIWNGLTRPLAYEAEITALRGGKLMKRMSTICTVPAGAVGYEVWPDPVISVTLSKFAETPADKHVCQ